MTYLTKTDTTLATIGSTKAGGIFAPEVFHEALFAGEPWGTAFREWYNHTGKGSDEWYFGIAVLGDPLLTLVSTEQASKDTEEKRRIPTARPWRADELQALRETMSRSARDTRVKSFEEYKRAHPTFF